MNKKMIEKTKRGCKLDEWEQVEEEQRFGGTDKSEHGRRHCCGMERGEKEEERV
jgi:hypothetical protein